MKNCILQSSLGYDNVIRFTFWYYRYWVSKMLIKRIIEWDNARKEVIIWKKFLEANARR
jgi:hypothetical protein